MNILELVKKECVKNWIKENYIEVSENGGLSIEYYIDSNEESDIVNRIKEIIEKEEITKNLLEKVESDIMENYYDYDETCNNALSELAEIEDLTEDEKELLKDNLFIDFSEVYNVIKDTEFKFNFSAFKEESAMLLFEDYNEDIDLSNIKVDLRMLEDQIFSLCFTVKTTLPNLNKVLEDGRYTDLAGKAYIINHYENELHHCDIINYSVDLTRVCLFSDYDNMFLQSDYDNDINIYTQEKQYNENKEAIAFLYNSFLNIVGGDLI